MIGATITRTGRFNLTTISIRPTSTIQSDGPGNARIPTISCLTAVLLSFYYTDALHVEMAEV